MRNWLPPYFVECWCCVMVFWISIRHTKHHLKGAAAITLVCFSPVRNWLLTLPLSSGDLFYCEYTPFKWWFVLLRMWKRELCECFCSNERKTHGGLVACLCCVMVFEYRARHEAPLNRGTAATPLLFLSYEKATTPFTPFTYLCWEWEWRKTRGEQNHHLIGVQQS